MARTIFDEIVTRSDYGIDLHTAAVRRTNYPNVRGDTTDSKVRRLAEAFSSQIIINGKDPKGAFRREACRAGCPTIIMEGGEVWKVEPSIVESGERGVKNVLRSLQMLDGPMTTLPAVSPGEPVCNLGKLPKGTKASDLVRQRSQNDSLEERVSEDLASSVLVVEPTNHAD